MATTLLPIDPAMSPERVSRILTISANLLPEETIAGRRARRVLIWVAVVVVLVAALCGTWFGYAYHQKQSAEQELEAATAEVRTLQVAQRDYAETVQVQNDITTLTGQLKTVMTNDLDWGALFDTLRRAGAPAGIKVGDVNGQLDAADGRGPGTSAALPSTNPATSIGSLVVTGWAPDKQAVATYVEALAKQTTVTNPYVTSVATDDDGGVTFSLTTAITQESLCGRFTGACPGGK
jgi:hypothetical protein